MTQELSKEVNYVMAQIPYEYTNNVLRVDVELTNASNVFLVDSINYQNYINRRRFNYHGGYYNRSPLSITVQGAGNWYLIVEDSNYRYKFHTS